MSTNIYFLVLPQVGSDFWLWHEIEIVNSSFAKFVIQNFQVLQL